LISHRTTSHDHHEADDSIERMVQILKKGLWKYKLQKERTSDWDIQLPWLAMGYQFNKQTFLA
jgi:hypothetical protein